MVLVQWLTKIVLGTSKYERIKLLLLSSAFFCVMGCYTILRELRDSLFVSIVGCEFIQHAQIISMFAILPLLFVYSRLIDQFTKYQLLYGITILYGMGGVFAALLVAHPTIGLANDIPSRYRLFGWVLFVFIEGFTAFVMSLFLGVVNSLISPKQAPKGYSIIVAGSKLGGMVAALFGWWFLSITLQSVVESHQLLLLFSSGLVLMVPVCIVLLRKWVPEEYLRGYEASYIAEKEQESTGIQPWYQSIISGPLLMFKYPYVLGIFFLASFWGLISFVLLCHRLNWCVVETNGGGITLSGILFQQVFWAHVSGLFISLVVVRLSLAYLGERRSLLLVPISTALLLGVYFSQWYAALTSISYILIRAINYSMAVSLREMLYIPTSKEVRFKSKSWTDAFGMKCAGGLGALYAIVTSMGSKASSNSMHMIFCGTIMILWICIAYGLGRRYEQAVKHNEVIGLE